MTRGGTAGGTVPATGTLLAIATAAGSESAIVRLERWMTGDAYPDFHPQHVCLVAQGRQFP